MIRWRGGCLEGRDRDVGSESRWGGKKGGEESGGLGEGGKRRKDERREEVVERLGS